MFISLKAKQEVSITTTICFENACKQIYNQENMKQRLFLLFRCYKCMQNSLFSSCNSNQRTEQIVLGIGFWLSCLQSSVDTNTAFCYMVYQSLHAKISVIDEFSQDNICCTNDILKYTVLKNFKKDHKFKSDLSFACFTMP